MSLLAASTWFHLRVLLYRMDCLLARRLGLDGIGIGLSTFATVFRMGIWMGFWMGRGIGVRG